MERANRWLTFSHQDNMNGLFHTVPPFLIISGNRHFESFATSNVIKGQTRSQANRGMGEHVLFPSWKEANGSYDNVVLGYLQSHFAICKILPHHQMRWTFWTQVASQWHRGRHPEVLKLHPAPPPSLATVKAEKCFSSWKWHSRSLVDRTPVLAECAFLHFVSMGCTFLACAVHNMILLKKI